MKKLLTLSGAAIYQDPEKHGVLSPGASRLCMRVLLFITTAVFSILAVGLCMLTWLIFALAPGPLSLGNYLGISAIGMIAVACVAGQWLAWRGYNRKKNNLIVLGMCLSSSPIAVFLMYFISK
jgi:hypothetical protein